MNIRNAQIYFLNKTELGSADAVAHYTSRKKAIDILSTGLFRLSSIGRVNDIGEAVAPHLVFPELPDEFSDDEPDYQSSLRAWFKSECSRRVQIGCLSMKRSSHKIDALEKSCVGSVLLWAFYGDRGRGAALVFDRRSLVECMQLSLSTNPCQADNIEYLSHVKRAGVSLELGGFSKSAIGIAQDAMDCAKLEIWGQLMDRVSKVFFLKDELWCWEKEFRIVGISASGDQLQLDIKKHRSLRAVVLGPNWDLNSSDGVLCLFSTGVPIFRICQSSDGSMRFLWVRDSKPPSSPGTATD